MDELEFGVVIFFLLDNFVQVAVSAAKLWQSRGQKKVSTIAIIIHRGTRIMRKQTLALTYGI